MRILKLLIISLFLAQSAWAVDADTALLLHCNGADSGTTFTDSSSNSYSSTAYGNAHTDTGEKKFGSASLRMDGTTDYLSSDCSATIGALGTDDFTIDMWFYIDTTAPGQHDGYMFDTDTDTDRIAIWFTGSTLTSYFADTSGVAITADVIKDAWVHFAYVKNSGTAQFYLNGILQHNDGTAANDYDTANDMIWGMRGNQAANTDWDGWFDEIRISDTARWTADFTPPTSEYNGAPPSAVGSIIIIS